jgi:hypothetical protein
VVYQIYVRASSIPALPPFQKTVVGCLKIGGAGDALLKINGAASLEEQKISVPYGW